MYKVHVQKWHVVNNVSLNQPTLGWWIAVIMADYYDLPFNDILNWKTFSLILRERNYGRLKQVLQDVNPQDYQILHAGVRQVRFSTLCEIPCVLQYKWSSLCGCRSCFLNFAVESQVMGFAHDIQTNNGWVFDMNFNQGTCMSIKYPTQLVSRFPKTNIDTHLIYSHLLSEIPWCHLYILEEFTILFNTMKLRYQILSSLSISLPIGL